MNAPSRFLMVEVSSVSSLLDGATPGAGQSPGFSSPAVPTAHALAMQAREATRGLRPIPARAFDPWELATSWPDRWRQYLYAHFRNHHDVQQAFAVDEKTARKWWTGEGSCRGDKVAMAMAMHPESARPILFPAAD